MQSRVVALIDMDCFYVQVEQRLAPEWKGKPCAVVQYNDWKGGGIIAVGYEARAKGVTRRGMRGEEARQVCPDIKLFKVPEVRGKADLTRYRNAGAEVITVLSQFEGCRVERASVDEAYIDLTDQIEEDMMSKSSLPTIDDLPFTYIVGSNGEDQEGAMKEWLNSLSNPESLDSHNDTRLTYGALIVERMRKAVKDQTGFSCSGGISHNKVLSKLACGINKPQKQTILNASAVPDLFATFPVAKVRHFGGKLGQSVKDDFNVEHIGELTKIPKQELCSQYGTKTGNFIYEMCRGHDPEPVSSRQLPKSVGCSKNFRGKLMISNYEKARYWLKQLSTELEERLNIDREQNNRLAKSLCLTVRFSDYQSQSRALPLTKYTQVAIENSAMAALTKLCGGETPVIEPAITCLGLSAGKFEETDNRSLTNFFQNGGGKPSVDIFDTVAPPSKGSNTHKQSTSATSACVTSGGYGLRAFLSSTPQSVDPFNTLTKSDKVRRKGITKYFGKTDDSVEQSKDKYRYTATCDDVILYGPDMASVGSDILDVSCITISSIRGDGSEDEQLPKTSAINNSAIQSKPLSDKNNEFLDDLISIWSCDSSSDVSDPGETLSDDANSSSIHSKTVSCNEDNLDGPQQSNVSPSVVDEITMIANTSTQSHVSQSNTPSTSFTLSKTKEMSLVSPDSDSEDVSFLDAIEREEILYRQQTNQMNETTRVEGVTLADYTRDGQLPGMANSSGVKSAVIADMIARKRQRYRPRFSKGPRNKRRKGKNKSTYNESSDRDIRAFTQTAIILEENTAEDSNSVLLPDVDSESTPLSGDADSERGDCGIYVLDSDVVEQKTLSHTKDRTTPSFTEGQITPQPTNEDQTTPSHTTKSAMTVPHDAVSSLIGVNVEDLEEEDEDICVIWQSEKCASRKKDDESSKALTKSAANKPVFKIKSFSSLRSTKSSSSLRSAKSTNPKKRQITDFFK